MAILPAEGPLNHCLLHYSLSFLFVVISKKRGVFFAFSEKERERELVNIYQDFCKRSGSLKYQYSDLLQVACP
jgi:hypothetical protein